MKIVERIEAWGHKNITARNRTTLEITKDTHLTLRGDCIIAVNATKGAADLCEEFKELARKEETRITIMLDAGGLRDVVNGFGSLSLTFTHPSDLVARKSTFTCSRTLMINCDSAARDFPSDFVKFLKNPDQKIIITLIAED